MTESLGTLFCYSFLGDNDTKEFKLDGCNCKRSIRDSSRTLQKQSTKEKHLQPANLETDHGRNTRDN